MKHILVGTNRPNSNTRKIGNLVKDIYKKEHQEDVEMIDLSDVFSDHVIGASYSGKTPHSGLAEATKKIETSDGVIIVTPEYNGSAPGVLKYFIDHLKYPEAFESRPLCFIGLGGRFGGLRPVEHLQQVFGYRNGFVYPERVFITGIERQLEITKDNPKGTIQDEFLIGLIKKQATGFCKFVEALKWAGLHPSAKNPDLRKEH